MNSKDLIVQKIDMFQLGTTSHQNWLFYADKNQNLANF